MDLSPLKDWLQDPENVSLLVVIASLLLAWAIWYGARSYRRHFVSGREFQRAERELAYRAFTDALNWVMASLEDELASTPSGYGVMNVTAGEDPNAQDDWWQESVRLDSDAYRQALAHLRAASDAVELYGSPRARRLAVGLLAAAQKAGEGHTGRTHHEILKRLLSWLGQGRDRFRRVSREDLGHGD